MHTQRLRSANSRDSFRSLSESQSTGSVNSRENGHNTAEVLCRGSSGNMSRSTASWGQLDPQQERDVRELIRHVAGLQDEADPNFQLALHFAWSNFRCGRGSRAEARDRKGSSSILGARPGFPTPSKAFAGPAAPVAAWCPNAPWISFGVTQAY